MIVGNEVLCMQEKCDSQDGPSAQKAKSHVKQWLEYKYKTLSTEKYIRKYITLGKYIKRVARVVFKELSIDL